MSDNTLKAAEAADALVAALWPVLEEYRSGEDKEGGAALPMAMTLAKPYIRQALARIEGMGMPADRRTVPYRISAMFWDTTDGEGEAELIADTDDPDIDESTVCHGLQACLEKLALWIAELHEGESLSDEASMAAIVKRVPSLRVAIARGAGSGQFRVHYNADGTDMLAHATVRRISEQDEA